MFASCASNSGGETKFSDNWRDNPPADTSEFHYEVGYAKGSTLQTTREWAKATRTGVTYKFQNMDDGGVYVLAALSIGSLAEELKSIVNESFVKNEVAEEANKTMNAAIDKYFN